MIEQQIEKIMKGLALEASVEVDYKEKQDVELAAYSFAYLVAEGNIERERKYLDHFRQYRRELELQPKR